MKSLNGRFLRPSKGIAPGDTFVKHRPIETRYRWIGWQTFLLSMTKSLCLACVVILFSSAQFVRLGFLNLPKRKDFQRFPQRRINSKGWFEIYKSQTSLRATRQKISVLSH